VKLLTWGVLIFRKEEMRITKFLVALTMASGLFAQNAPVQFSEADRKAIQDILKAVTKIPGTGGSLTGDNGSTKPYVPPPPPGPTAREKSTEAYWASRPSYIQALRKLPSDERIARATQLTALGIPVDNEIEVFLMDPFPEMTRRKNFGYTWFPAFGQNFAALVPAAPGITLPNGRSYDPNNPPPGTIKVSLDFAKGIE